jgi:hypothetical protein
VFFRQGEAPIDIPPFVLDENMRNTKEIAQLFGSLSGEKLKPRGMAGAKVRLYDMASEDVLDVVKQPPGIRSQLLRRSSRHPCGVRRPELTSPEHVSRYGWTSVTCPVPRPDWSLICRRLRLPSAIHRSLLRGES